MNTALNAVRGPSAPVPERCSILMVLARRERAATKKVAGQQQWRPDYVTSAVARLTLLELQSGFRDKSLKF